PTARGGPRAGGTAAPHRPRAPAPARTRSVSPGAAALGLEPGAVLLGRPSTTPGATGGARGAPPRWWGSEGVAQQVRDPLACRPTVALLRSVLRGVDGEHGADEASPEAGERPLPLLLGQGTRATQVERELDPGVRGVHALTTRSARTREALGQLTRRDEQALRHSRPRRDTKIGHAPHHPSCGGRCGQSPSGGRTVSEGGVRSVWAMTQ